LTINFLNFTWIFTFCTFWTLWGSESMFRQEREWEGREKPENGKEKGWIRIPVKRRRAAPHLNLLFFPAMTESESQGHSWISYAVSLFVVLLIALHVFALVTLTIYLFFFFFTSSKPNLITYISIFQVYWIYRLVTDNRSQQQQQQEQQQVRRKAHWLN